MLETKGWPPTHSAYTLSKAALNAYTRHVAKNYPNLCVNSVDPEFVKTNLSCNAGILTIDEGAKNVASMATMAANNNPSGLYFYVLEDPF